jgi:4,5:9,10-diseco-3-hydroxy-5,9,17-trioxoandrosta-1(10),2-diene-4-oate hydrolase
MKTIFSTPYEDRYVSINGGRVRYWEVGPTAKVGSEAAKVGSEAVESILLIHGLGGSIEQWFANIKALSGSHRVICLDIPGCGKSDPLHDMNYSLESLSRFLDQFTCALNLEIFNFVGLSMGGALCLRYVIDNPAKVNKLVLVGSAGLGYRMALVFRLLTLPLIDRVPGLLTRRQFAKYVRSMVYDPSVITEDILDFYYPILKSPGTRNAFIKTLKDNCSLLGLRKKVVKGIVQQLERIEQQTLIIWGKQDKHMPFANVNEAMKVMKAAKLVFFDKCAHNPQFEKAEDFNRAVNEFLKE